jgi:hypothetical protein
MSAVITDPVLTWPQNYIFNFILSDAMAVDMRLTSYSIDVEAKIHSSRLYHLLGCERLYTLTSGTNRQG